MIRLIKTTEEEFQINQLIADDANESSKLGTIPLSPMNATAIALESNQKETTETTEIFPVGRGQENDERRRLEASRTLAASN